MAGRPRVLYVQYTNPGAYPPLVHGARILARAGARVRLLGTPVAGTEALAIEPCPGVEERRLGRQPRGRRQRLHYARYLLWVVAWTRRWRPDWLYASDPLACPVALAAAAVGGARVVYHEHDSPDAVAARGLMRLVLHARGRLAAQATLCVLPQAARAARFEAETGRRGNTICAWNCPALDEVGPAREPWQGPHLWLLYHGSIVPGRLPLTVLEALAKLPPAVRLRVVGYETAGHVGYLGHLVEAAASLGLAERVEVVGPVPRRQDLLRWAQASDIGLALMPNTSTNRNEQAMVGASNKPFDYLARGVVPLVSDLPPWRATYVEPGYALACDPENPASIAAAVQRLLDEPEAMRAMGERGRRRILQEWHYERQFAPVLATMLPAPRAVEPERDVLRGAGWAVTGRGPTRESRCSP
jgi:glycosyltransferase involved in cell wall biosynthesis